MLMTFTTNTGTANMITIHRIHAIAIEQMQHATAMMQRAHAQHSDGDDYSESCTDLCECAIACAHDLYGIVQECTIHDTDDFNDALCDVLKTYRCVESVCLCENMQKILTHFD